MNPFDRKTLTFYGIALAFVLALFKVVTLYGETRLSASFPISGTYLLTPSAKSPCTGPDARLTVEQSGIYLFGTLFANGEKIALDGRFRGDTFYLQGRPGNSKSCPDGISIEATARDRVIDGTLQGFPVTFKKEELPAKTEG